MNRSDNRMPSLQELATHDDVLAFKWGVIRWMAAICLLLSAITVAAVLYAI